MKFDTGSRVERQYRTSYGNDLPAKEKEVDTMATPWTTVRNLTMAAKLLLLVVLVATVLAFVAWAWLRSDFPLPSDQTLRVAYLEQYLGLVQVIAVGVVVTLVSVIIPMMLPEARDRFERYKESRRAYSRAKTAVMYLPDRVASVDRERAFLLVEEAHRELHLAETFEDVIIEKGYLRWFSNPDLWVLYNYWQIVAIAEVLRKFDWSATEKRGMLKDKLHDTLDVVHSRFGRRGDKCEREKWKLEDGSRFREEDKLEKSIFEKLT